MESELTTEWKFARIPGHPDYIVCDDGTFYSTKTNKKLNLKASRHGYMRVRVHHLGKQHLLWAQRIVAGCFIGEVNGHEVHHKDNCRWNNRATNLEIVTKQKNIEYRNINNGWAQGEIIDTTYPSIKHSNPFTVCPMGKISPSDKREWNREFKKVMKSMI